MAAPTRDVARVLLLVAVTATAGAVAGQLCNRYAPHYSVLATHHAPGPWEASLDVVRHAPSPRLHFAVRPTSSQLADKLTVTIKGRLPVGQLEAVDDDFEEVEVAGAGGGARWYKVHAARVTWAEARAVCEAAGAHLVLVDTADEALALSGLLSRHAHAVSRDLHAGFYAADYANSFYSVDGQPLTASGYEGWGPRQPDLSICGRIDLQGRLRDGMCDWVEPASFVCEREASGFSKPAPVASFFAGPAAVPLPTAPPRSGGYAPLRPQGDASLYKLHTLPATWWEAEGICEEEGSRLAVLNSKAEADVVKELVKRADKKVLPYIYVGARAEFNFVTIFGIPLSDASYNLWAPDYPAFNNCVVASHNGSLWVTQCWAKYPFICEWASS